MMKKFIGLLIILTISYCYLPQETHGTQSFFQSPYGLGKTPQVTQALANMQSQLKLKQTTYTKSGIIYTLSNIMIQCDYNDAKQNTSITGPEEVTVTGGRIEFSYRFNFTKTQNRINTTGTGYGSILSDALTYRKELALSKAGFLIWETRSSRGYDNLNISNKLKIKRIDPFNQTDATTIEQMLNDASADPAPVKSQLLQLFNQIFPLALNDSLNHETFGQTVSYTYYSNTHGQMKMNMIHKLWGFGIDPTDGYRVIFVTQIENWNEPLCNITVTQKPSSFEIYGGSQNFQLNCIYESVVFYMQEKGWLDTILNDNWETNAFQFYAGDLFDVINNLYLTFNPRSLLDGECLAQKDGLRFYPSREFDANTYTLAINYKCSVRGSNKQGITAQILRFTTSTKIYIKLEAKTRSLEWKIVFADNLNLSFQPVGNYYVTNIALATYKANQVLHKLIGTTTFGTGYPILPRELPKTRVDTDYAFFYDASHIGKTSLF